MSETASSAPAVTVLMTMYNAAEHLRAAVASILAQTFADFEFVIVDDGSQDDSAAIVGSFRDPRIRLVRNAANRGQTACLNQGLAFARGAWIARQDADDLSHPRRLERQMARLRREDTLALLGCQAWLIDGAGRFTGLLNVPLGPASIAWAALFENPFVHTAVVFRREIALELGGYDETFRICQDYDLWMRIAAKHPTANLAERLVSYRRTPHSLQHSARETVREESRRVVEAAWKRAFTRTEISADERAALLAFRTGLSLEQARGFRKMYARLLAGYRRGHPEFAQGRDARRTVALHEAKLGRDLAAAHWWAGAAGLARAFALDPPLLLRLAAERLARTFCVRP